VSVLVRGLVIDTHDLALVWPVPADLPHMQQLVGGCIEAVLSPRGGGWHAYVNEEGLLLHLPYNRYASELVERAGRPGIRLYGTAVFLGHPKGGSDDTDVPDALVQLARRIGLPVGDYVDERDRT